MAKVIITSPTVARVLDVPDQERKLLEMQLTFRDQKVQYELQKHKKSHWYLNKYGQEAWQERLDDLKSKVQKCLLMEDQDGLWVYSGLADKVARILGCSVENKVEYPEEGLLGWDRKPDLTPYEYQTLSLERLLQARHAGVEIGTGLGKSLIILMLAKELGLKTVIMAPATNIAERLYDDCVLAFGKKKVGFFGDGKKECGKLITVAVSASLTRVKEDTKEWENLSKAQVFIADESHQCPAATLAKVCFGLMKAAPYRFFFSATQMRNDGLDLLLDAITGPIVYRKTVREGIDEGYLAKLSFVMVKCASNSSLESYDVNEMTREHLLYNDSVIRKAASLANNFVALYKQQVLILVDEFEQVTRLYPHLKFEMKFAHGGVTKENKAKLPQMFWESDPKKLVAEFNNGDFPILVGTSCIATGTDVKANEVTIYLRGGKSEIEVMQGACGRSTRKFTFPRTGAKKTACTIVDFDVENIEAMHRHAEARKDIYNTVYGPVKEITYGA
jgi:superfamily II DNA or RNA helicase